MTLSQRNTAQSKIGRLVAKERILLYFQQFMKHLALVKPTDTINVDFSTFCGFQVLTFAKQTNLGRSLPVYIATITYPIKSEDSQTQFIEEQIQKFVTLLSFCPHLVFDRGFESPYLVPFLVRQKIPFSMRFRKDKHVLYCFKEIPLRNLPWFEKDCVVEVYEDISLRVVVSEKLSERRDGCGNEEPWYIITSDFLTTKEAVIGRYYFRFEIEETFKDLKHIQNLKKFYKIKKQQTFQVLLWFCILTIWLSFLLKQTKQYLVQRIKQQKRKKLSVVKFFTESIQLELFTFFRNQFFQQQKKEKDICLGRRYFLWINNPFLDVYHILPCSLS